LSIAVSRERAELLQELADGVKGCFRANSEFTRHEESDHNFIVCWPLPNRGNNLTTRSREISIRFREAWLSDFARTTDQDRQTAKNWVRAAVQARLPYYDDGSDTRKDVHLEPFIITIPDDLPDRSCI
jgi:hypothetical protein